MATPPLFKGHPAPFPGGIYRAVCNEIIDGDTFRVTVDLGFNQYSYSTIRLLGVDTPETRTRDAAEKLRGFAARERVRGLIEGKPVVIDTEPDPSTFGRYVASVRYWGNGRWEDLAGTLLQEGHAITMLP